MSGEADEDTMSAWSSLAGGGLGSPGDLGPSLSLRRRSSFGTHMSSFSEDPFHEPPPRAAKNIESELTDVGRGGDQGTDALETFGGVVDRPKNVASDVAPGGGRGTVAPEEPNEVAVRQPASEAQKEAKLGATPFTGGSGSTGDLKNTADSREGRSSEILAGAEEIDDRHPRRRSNQDDQSEGLDSKVNSARSGDEGAAGTTTPKMDSSVNGGSNNGEEGASRGEGIEFPLVALAVEESVASGGSDTRYVRDVPDRIPLTCLPESKPDFTLARRVPR